MKMKVMKNSDTEFVLRKNWENYLVPDEQSNVLIPEANINLVEDAEFKVNNKENNVVSEQENNKEMEKQ